MENQTCYCMLKKEAKAKLVFEQGDLYYCGNSECKEKILEKALDKGPNSFLYQGSTYKQYKSSADITYYGTISIISAILGYFIFEIITRL